MGTHTAVNLACGHPFYSAWHSIRRCKWTLPWQCKWTLTCQCKWTLTCQCKPTLNWRCKWILTWQCKRNLTWQCKQTSTWQCKWTWTWLSKWTLIWQCKWTLTWPCKWTLTWQCKWTLAITPIFLALPILVLAIILIITINIHGDVCSEGFLSFDASGLTMFSLQRRHMICRCASLRWLLSAQRLACNSTSCPRMQHASYPFCMSYLWPCLCQTLLMFILCFFATGNFYVMIYTGCGISHVFIYEWLFTWTSFFAVVI